MAKKRKIPKFSRENAPDEEVTARKIVIRNVPPSLNEKSFRNAIERFVDKIDWISFIEGNPSATEHRLGIAYVHFKSSDDVVSFQDAFHEHEFVDEKGIVYKIAVEYASYQRIPKDRLPEKWIGKFATNPNFVAFSDSLEEEVKQKTSAQLIYDKEKNSSSGSGDAQLAPLVLLVRKKIELKEKKFRKQKRTNKKGEPKSGKGRRAGDSGGPKKLVPHPGAHLMIGFPQSSSIPSTSSSSSTSKQFKTFVPSSSVITASASSKGKRTTTVQTASGDGDSSLSSSSWNTNPSSFKQTSQTPGILVGTPDSPLEATPTKDRNEVGAVKGNDRKGKGRVKGRGGGGRGGSGSGSRGRGNGRRGGRGRGRGRGRGSDGHSES